MPKFTFACGTFKPRTFAPRTWDGGGGAGPGPPVPPVPSVLSGVWLEPLRPVAWLNQGVPSVLLHKRSGETRTYVFDFTKQVEASKPAQALVAPATVTATDPALVLSGVAVSGRTVLVTVAAGKKWSVSTLTCVVHTTSGAVLRQSRRLAVDDTAMAFLAKYDTSYREYGFDLSLQPELAAGQLLTGTPSVTAAPSGLVVGSPSVEAATGLRVVVPISGGSPYNVYTLTCTAPTTGGSVLQAVGTLAVDDG